MTIIIEYVGIEIRFELDLDTKKLSKHDIEFRSKGYKKKRSVKQAGYFMLVLGLFIVVSLTRHGDEL